jgi:hypothetical protein
MRMLGDQHGPYWATFSKRGKLNAQLIERPGPHFIGNAENARQRIARVMVVEVSPEHDSPLHRQDAQLYRVLAMKPEFCNTHLDVQIVELRSISVNGGTVRWGCAICNLLRAEKAEAALRPFVDACVRPEHIEVARALLERPVTAQDEEAEHGN